MATFLSIPDELKLKVFFYISYNEIAKLRTVCRDFNRIGIDSLNQGFTLVQKYHSDIQREVKNKLPRRESERRDHKYNRHAEILSAIETRVSLLQITYAKYIEAGYSCFIPGKVAADPPRSHEVLMELRDISSMAMEHFEDKILPSLKKMLDEEGVTILPGGLIVGLERTESSSHSPRSAIKRRASGATPGFSPLAKRSRLAQPDLERTPTGRLNSSERICRGTLAYRMTACERIIEQQELQIEEQAGMLSELNRKLADYNHRFNDLADLLSNHYESARLQDKIAALIQPVRGESNDSASNTPLAGCASFTSVRERSHRLGDTSVSSPISLTPTSLTSLSSDRDSRRYSSIKAKSLEKRVKLLNDDMDVMRDQLKL
ncbi:F-box only protein 28-like isoform X2 [Watersipora subatra]|uniref:F-box only protein 28-like isoform X2 n=1 Tax=Watersipora subatra TaxID=2589382 RepID=UPI00355C5638